MKVDIMKNKNQLLIHNNNFYLKNITYENKYLKLLKISNKQLKTLFSVIPVFLIINEITEDFAIYISVFYSNYSNV